MKSLDDCECLPNFLGDNGVVGGRVGPRRVCVRKFVVSQLICLGEFEINSLSLHAADPLLCSYCFPLQSDLALDYQLYALGNISLISNPVEVRNARQTTMNAEVLVLTLDLFLHQGCCCGCGHADLPFKLFAIQNQRLSHFFWCDSKQDCL